MATAAIPETMAPDRERFFHYLAIAMAVTVFAGFSMNWLLGRSTFQAKTLIHAHAMVFMVWVAYFLLQTRLATHGSIALHRKLGWFGAGWVVLMLVMGSWLTVDRVADGKVPFFFQPQFFLIANPMGIVCFAGLVWWAVRMRHRTDWHRRLQICAMGSIMGPAFGRLLPMPLLIPFAFDVAVAVGMVFPVVGMIRDKRNLGRVHPSWWLGMLAVLVAILVAHLLAFSTFGDAIYAAVTAGKPGANVPGLEYPPFPPMIL